MADVKIQGVVGGEKTALVGTDTFELQETSNGTSYWGTLDNIGVFLEGRATNVTAAWSFNDSGLGGLTNYDLSIGDTDGTPTYGMLRIGNSTFGRTSYNTGNLDLDGSLVLWNNGTPATSNIEFAFAESSNVIRFAIPKSGVGNATYNPRSMLIAGPAPSDDTMVTVGYWQGQGIFNNLVCDTSTTGADLGVQNDLEVEGDIFTDSIKESTTAAGVTIDGVLIKDGAIPSIPSCLVIAAGDETTDLTVADDKVTFRMPYDYTLTEVRASVTTAPTGSSLIADVDLNGTSIMTTNKLEIEVTEKSTKTATTQPTLTTTALTDDDELQVNINQIGSTVAGAGLKVYLIGYPS
jgi:hypothetical protein